MMLVEKRYEFSLLYDVENGNPNGDPDAGNMPRTDPQTNHGIVTDVCLKRKVRDYVQLVKDGAPGFDIYVTEGIPLNSQHMKAYKALDLEPNTKDKRLPKDKGDAQKVVRFMTENFYDIRTFGAVMTTEVNCGQIRGPVQLNFSRSIDPIMWQTITLTRVTITNEKDADKKEHDMGNKHIVPYALYRVDGYVSAHLAQKAGFSEEDLELFWEALMNMFEHDHSAARGKMSTRGLYIFEHSSALGNAPAHKLFDLIDAKRIDETTPARKFSDYAVTVREEELPAGVKLIKRV